MFTAMTYEEFKRNVRAAGLSIQDFASLMGMPHRQAITNYSKVGFVPDHFAVIVRLMVALVDAGGDVRAALGGLEMKRKLGRGGGFEKSTSE
jgi:hypothetical protein